jgi:high-affinity iron transporter
MFSSFLLTLREGLEAALLLGIVFAVLQNTGVPGMRRSVWLGVAGAVLASLVAGGALFTTGAELEGTSEEAFEAGTMLAAAAVLTWVVFWMRRYGARLVARLKGDTAAAAATGGLALASLGFLIVAREGFETALFLFATQETADPIAALAGGALGLATAVGIGYAAYRGSTHLRIGSVFAVLNVLLLGLAAYMVAGGVAELAELVGGEAAETAGPIAGVAYAVLALLFFFRAGRRSTRGPERTAQADRREQAA